MYIKKATNRNLNTTKKQNWVQSLRRNTEEGGLRAHKFIPWATENFFFQRQGSLCRYFGPCPGA